MPTPGDTEFDITTALVTDGNPELAGPLPGWVSRLVTDGDPELAGPLSDPGWDSEPLASGPLASGWELVGAIPPDVGHGPAVVIVTSSLPL